MSLIMTQLPQMSSLPGELLDYSNWLGWRAEKREGKMTKLPYSPRTGRLASSTDPATWTSFDVAAAFAERTNCDGVGFVFTQSPFVGIDLDHCVDLRSGEIEPWALEIVERFGSYTELSPSGTGLHIIVRGELPEGRKKKHVDGGHPNAAIEVYDTGRYFTITGRHLGGIPFDIVEAPELAAWHAETFPAPPPEERERTEPSTPVSVDDARLLELAENAHNGSAFAALWQGEWRSAGYGSQSEADLALCNHLAFWTGKDAHRIDALFRRSGLMRPKWDGRRGKETYGSWTIARAISGTTETYPGPSLEVDLGRPSGSTAAIPDEPESEQRWPEPLAAEAFAGLAGEVAELFSPHTEADPTAVLVQFITAFANAVGPAPHVMVGPTRHGTRISAVVVGNTSRARKGDSWQCVRELFKHAEPDWLSRCVSTGLSTGEGLINVVKDGMIDLGQPGRVVGGEIDRRVLAVETEFGRTLRAMAREGNTLSAVLRDAWDGRDLAVMTRGTPLRATGAHIGIIGHVTVPELRRELSATDAHNGFANRFLWTCAKRSKFLPDPAPVPQNSLEHLAARVTMTLDAARRLGTLMRDEDTRALWREIYPSLTHDHGGLAGDILARSEAQVLRLSMVYALLDTSPLIRPHHLAAAVALWDYCTASVFHIFGSASGDGIADDILRFLSRGGEHSRTDISALLGRNVKSERITVALTSLERSGRIACRIQESGGRPTEIWSATGVGMPARQPLLPDLIRNFVSFVPAKGGVGAE